MKLGHQIRAYITHKEEKKKKENNRHSHHEHTKMDGTGREFSVQ
jgi:hypothetical protein